MARFSRTTGRIKDEIAKLHEQLRRAEDREAERLGRLAIKAGLHEVNGSDNAILKGYRDLARQFQTKNAPTSNVDKTETGND